MQTPAPELGGLRAGPGAWRCGARLTVLPAAAAAVQGIAGAALTVDLTVDSAASSAASFSVLLLSEARCPSGRPSVLDGGMGASPDLRRHDDDALF